MYIVTLKAKANFNPSIKFRYGRVPFHLDKRQNLKIVYFSTGTSVITWFMRLMIAELVKLSFASEKKVIES